MVFKTGFVANSHHLTAIIHASMRDAGWSLISGIESDGTDSVLYSDGEDGYQDIYLRVAAKQADLIATGDIQFPHSDGYRDYVNFLAYQFFPNDGAASSGVAEIGRLGPTLYLRDTDSATASRLNIEEYNFYSSTAGSSNQRELTVNSITNAGATSNLFDGHRYMWLNISSNNLTRVDLGQSTKNIVASTRSSTFFTSDALRATAFSKISATEPLLWLLKTSPNNGLATFNVADDSVIDVAAPSTTYALPPWGTAGSGAWVVQGLRRSRNKYLYVARGAGSLTWARYDIDDNSWVTLDATGRGSLSSGSYGIMIPKEVTGYTNDRIYATAGGNTTFYSVAIDDSGDVSGTWTTHAALPATFSSDDSIFYVGGDRIFATFGTDDDLHHWVFPGTATDNGSWVTDSAAWFAESNVGNISVGTQYHLSCRVKVDEHQPTKYWLFVNKDRVIVVTDNDESSNSSGKHISYAGLFESYSSNKNNTTLATTVASSATTLEVTDSSFFKIGSSYRIVDLVAGSNSTGFNGVVRSISSAEIITVTDVKQNSVSPEQIVISPGLQNGYAAGAIIGEDIQPVCTSVEGMAKFQSLNTVNTSATTINDDPAYQWYEAKAPQLSLQTLGERNDTTTAWPIVLTNPGTADTGAITSADTRGQLKGMFITSSAIDDESEVTISGQTFIKFTTFNTPIITSVLIGPAE